jgi:hypothetical protein
MRRVLGLAVLVLGVCLSPAPAWGEQVCEHDMSTHTDRCYESTPSPPQTAAPTTKPAAVATTRPIARAATTAPRAAASRTAGTAATVATTTTVPPTTTTVPATTTTAAVTLDTEPVAKQGSSSNPAPAVIGAVLVAALAFGAFQLISRRRSA